MVTSDATKDLSLASLLIHADDGISSHRAVAPAMHVSTTFRYNDDPDKLVVQENIDVRAFVLQAKICINNPIGKCAVGLPCIFAPDKLQYNPV